MFMATMIFIMVAMNIYADGFLPFIFSANVSAAVVNISPVSKPGTFLIGLSNNGRVIFWFLACKKKIWTSRKISILFKIRCLLKTYFL